MSVLVGEIFLILVLIVANGFFSAAELAIIAARKGRLQQRAEAGDKKAQLALRLAADPNQFLPTVQVGITLVNTFAAAFGGAHVVYSLGELLALTKFEFVVRHNEAISLGLVVLSITFLSLILGELVPKRLALRQAESLARLTAPALYALSKIAKPVIWLMNIISDTVLTMLLIRANDEPNVSVDDIAHLIDAGTAEGVLQPVEQRVALEALRLGDRQVRDVMRPRLDLDALDVETPQEQVLGSVAMAGFSRLPVYEGDLDHILGYVHIKDLFRHQYLGWPIELRKLLHPALFVPETLPLDRLLELFQERHNQLAIVLDEFGGTEGMVTLEDVIEKLVGEIRDLHRDEAQMFVARDDGSWLVDGALSLADLIERLGLKLEEGSDLRGFSTVSGLVLDRLGRIPNVGDRMRWNGLAIEVVDMDGQRIDRLLISRASPEQENSPVETS